MIRLEGKVALVTGASKGIGKATALLFAQAGAAVGVHYRTDAGGAARVASAIEDMGGKAITIGADLARWGDATTIVARTERALGPVDVVVCNAGIWESAPITEMTEADWDRTIDVNLKCVACIAGSAARSMRRRRGGRILLVASTAGQRGEAEHAHYAASKGGVIALTKSLAAELAPAGILVNCVAPGWVETPMTETVLQDTESSRAVRATIPLGRVGRPEEIAGALLFLASDLSTFVTGEVLNVNGGAVLCG
jgi:3-oxoacyl-[acyl-carrier protein] reductase